MIPIVFASDHNFIIPSCVTLHSLLTTRDNENVAYDIIVIIDPDVNEEDKKILTKQVSTDSSDSKIRFIEIGDIFEKGFEIRDISRACYNRLMIPWLLPEYDKVIYSDVDIIFKEDISEVYKFDLKDSLVAGVGGNVWKKGLINKYIKKIKADPDEYINSGFLLINCSLQREEGLQDKYLEYSKRKFIYQDQDIINLVCKGRIAKLPEEYNVKPIDSYDSKRKRVKAIHFIGLKPWQYFTYAWNDWWDCFNSSIVYDSSLNRKISGLILNPTSRIKFMLKALKQKLKFIKQYITFRQF